MNKRRWIVVFLAALALTLLVSCGQKDGGGTSASESGSGSAPEEPSVPVIAPVEPDPEPVYPYTNPLTGEGLNEDISAKRPVAIMLNNLKKALPQIGVGQADVIYEIEAEGGITRMMAVYQDIADAGDLGAVRSARDYYVNLALGHDAIYIHAGGSPQAYDAFDSWGVTHIDFVNGPYGSMCWRDAERRKNAGYEHSLLTSSEKILEQMPSRFRLEHTEGYEVGWSFSKDVPSGSAGQAEMITVPFSSYKTGHFSYDAESKQYFIEQHIDGTDVAYVDGADGEPVGVNSVVVVYTDISQVKGDEAGRRSVRTTGSGNGLLFRDGQYWEITWQRDARTDNYTFLDSAGQPIALAVGPSYINVVSTSSQVAWE